MYLLLPSLPLSALLSLLLKLCQAVAAVPEVLLELTGCQQYLGKIFWTRIRKQQMERRG